MAATLLRALQPVASKVNVAKASGGLLFQTGLLLAALAIGGALLVVGPFWARSVFGAVKLDGLAGFTAVAAALVLAVLTHEAGHFGTAVALDFEILAISAGPLRWQWLHGQSALQVSWKRLLTCSISAVPRRVDENWRKNMLLVIGAGPAATLLLLVVSLTLALASAQQTDHGGWLGSFWSASAELNFFLFVLGLIPNGNGAVMRNDATLLRIVRQNGVEAEDLKMAHRTLELKLAAIRPADFPAEGMCGLAKWNGRPETNWMIAKSMVDWAIDLGDLKMADAWDRHAAEQAEHCERRTRNTALAEAGCFDVLFRNNLRGARMKFAEVDFDSLFPPCLAERARAARLVANGLPHWAYRNILRAQYALPLGLAYYDYERSLLDRLHALAARSFGS